MTRLDAFVVFPPRYARTPAGLGAAEQELARLTATHTAYANQPNISKIWQGYIDKQADAVDAQRAIVEALRRAIAGSTTRSPRLAGITRNLIEAVGGKRSTAQR